VPGERAVLLTAAGAAFLALLDTTVANLAVADVRSDFAGASVGAATWIITIYAITTGTSTAAALSVAPERFAAAGGLNQTARQVGGALGIAVLAALLEGGRSETGVGPFADVYLFCTLATLAVAVAALWLVLEEKTA